ncbi:MAG: hypothetical protein HY043_17400 [Verrucomicrobia bacterium]|nr:hypothetical protein [Verrucomicrobiota bacterium]
MPPSPARFFKLRHKVTLGLFICIALFVASRFVRGSARQRALEKFRAAGYPTTLTELDAWYPAVPDEQNGAPRLLDAATSIRSEKTEALPVIGWKTLTPPRNQAWAPETLRDTQAYFAANRESLASLTKALEFPRFRFPINFKKGWTVADSDRLALQSAAASLSLKAQYEAERGDGAAAAQALRDLQRLARTLELEPTSISQMVRYGAQRLGFRAAERTINRASLSEADLAMLQQIFLEPRPVNGLERGLAGELCFGIDGFKLPPTKIAEMFFLGIDGLDFEFFLRRMDERLATARADFPNRPSLSKPTEDALAAAAKLSVLRQPIISVMILPTLSGIFESDTRAVAQLRIAGVAMAVERFRLAHDGQLPENREQLAPKFFASIPADPFNGQPLRYRKLERAYVVYSVGKDLKDDGGYDFKPGPKERDKSDITFIVERP